MGDLCWNPKKKHLRTSVGHPQKRLPGFLSVHAVRTMAILPQKQSTIFDFDFLKKSKTTAELKKTKLRTTTKRDWDLFL